MEGRIGMEATKLEMNSLQDIAGRLKQLKPWEWMTESQLFVVKESQTPLMGFCCMQENKRNEMELKVYLGLEGLRHYIEMLDLDSIEPLQDVLGPHFSRETCLSVVFNQEEIKFYDCQFGFMDEELHQGWKVNFLSEVLSQIYELVKLMKETPSFLLNEDQTLMRLQDDLGQWKTLKVSLSIFLEQLKEEGIAYKNELEAYRVFKLPQTEMIFEIAQFLMPRAVEETEHSRAYYPMITAILEQETKQLVFVEMSSPTPKSQEEILSKFAVTLRNDLGFRPKQLVTDCEEIIRNFKDFSNQIKVPLIKVPELEAANSFINELMAIEQQMSEFIAEEEGIENEIELVLSTSKEICRYILSSDSLSGWLSEGAKVQFESIIELFHVVMLGHFHELPSHWSLNSVERACKEILPNLLTKEELVLVPEVLIHYLNVVGEAEKNPNYQVLEQCIRKCYL